MAGHECAICHSGFLVKTTKQPIPTVCDDCIIEKLWNVKLDGDVGGHVVMFQPQPPLKPAGRKRAA